MSEQSLPDKQKEILHKLLEFLGEDTAQFAPFTGDDLTQLLLVIPGKGKNKDRRQMFPDLTLGLLRLFHDRGFIHYSDEDKKIFAL